MIRCYTLFDISNTGVRLRNIPKNLSPTDHEYWINQLRCQCNFDTILQIISLRTQPEVLDIPRQSYWKNSKQICWEFTFDTYHDNVFGNNFSLLYEDCNMVPMIDNNNVGTVWLTPDNIFFEDTNELRV